MMKIKTPKRDVVLELHKPCRKNFNRRRVVMVRIDDLWQIDLVEMNAYSKVNKKFNYLLTITNWTTEIFRIRKIQHTNPVTYLLEDYEKKSVKGSFYEMELSKPKNPNIFFSRKNIKKTWKLSSRKVAWFFISTQFMD